MESTGRKSYVVFNRFMLLLMTVVFLVLTFIQIGVLMEMKFTQTLVQEAMCAGTVLWALSSVATSIFRLRLMNGDNDNPFPLGLILFYVVGAGVSFGGIYMPTFTILAFWANAILSAVFLVTMVMMFRKLWREFGNFTTEPEPTEPQ